MKTVRKSTKTKRNHNRKARRTESERLRNVKADEFSKNSQSGMETKKHNDQFIFSNQNPPKDQEGKSRHWATFKQVASRQKSSVLNAVWLFNLRP